MPYTPNKRAASGKRIDGLPDALPDLRGITVCERYLLRKRLGVGAFGVVYLARDTVTETPCAVKIMYKADPKSTRYHYQMREIQLHQQVSDHPNVVTLHRAIDDNEYIYLVLDYADGGDVWNCLEQYEGQDEMIKKTFLQLLDAVQHCHDNGVYHRDIKPENMLLREGQCLLADFGLSTNMSRTKDYGCGSPEYMAPEAVRRGKKDFLPTFSHVQSDIWSLGIVLCSMITGNLMWRIADPRRDNNFRLFAKSSRNLKDYFGLSEEAHQILRKMLAINPLDRKPLHRIREEVVLLTTFYKEREEIYEPPRPTKLVCLHPASRSSSTSSVESDGPITPETRPTIPTVDVPEMDKVQGEDIGESALSGLIRAKMALGAKLDEIIARTAKNNITPIVI